MGSINKKDLRLLRPGELIMAKKDLVLFHLTVAEPTEEEEEKASNWQHVYVAQGEILLVVEDYRKTNIAPNIQFLTLGKTLKVLYGEKVSWLNKSNHELLASWVVPVDPTTYTHKAK